MGKSTNNPSPTRIPRPRSPAGGASPTRTTPRRGTGLLQAVGRGNPFRSVPRAEGAGRLGALPLNITVAEAHGYNVGPMHPSVNTTYEQDPSQSASSRGPSASIMTGSPDSQLTTGYASATTSTTPEGTAGAQQGPLTSHPIMILSSVTGTPEIHHPAVHPYAPSVRHRRPGSSLPIATSRAPPARPPPSPCDIAYIPADAWTTHELKLAKKLPPASSEDSLGSKHRDSLHLTSLQNIPRLTPPGAKKGKFGEFFADENEDGPQSDSPLGPQGQNSGAGSQVSRESSVFDYWPVPGKVVGNSESEYVENAGIKESPGVTQNEGAQQKEVVYSEDDVEPKGGVTQKKSVEHVNDDQKENKKPSPCEKKADGKSKCCCETKNSSMNRPDVSASTRLDDLSAYNASKQMLFDQSIARSLRRQEYLESLPPDTPKSLKPGSGGESPTKTFNPHSQLPRPAQKAGEEKEGGIPKSRTRHVLNNLSTSLSRASLSSFRMHARRHTPSGPNDNDSPTTPQHPNESNLLPTQKRSRPHHLDKVRLIYDAQDSEWWTGRFQALKDRFSNENLSPGNMAIIISSTTKIPGPIGKPQNPAGLPSSSTMGNMSTSGGLQSDAQQRALYLTDEDMRARRVFVHLRDLCMTDEARASLYVFQQRYARARANAALLPPGGTMYDDPKAKTKDKGKGWVGRIFSGKDKDKDKEGGKKGGGPSR